MLYLNYTPHYPLSDFIESFWYAENAPAHILECLLPNGETDIVFNLQDARLKIYDRSDLRQSQVFSGPLFSGAHSKSYVVNTSQQASLMGVQFRPGGAYPFMGDSADRFQNHHVALEDLWGKSAIVLQMRLMEAKSHELRFRYLEQALLKRLSETVRPHPAVALAVSTFTDQQGNASISELADHCGLSSRRFIQLFRREVGLPPKLFCRILRFQRVLQLFSPQTLPDFAGLAFECGYYDQAHLIRDFKDFAGITPTAYLANRGAHYNHVALAEQGSNLSNTSPHRSGKINSI